MSFKQRPPRPRVRVLLVDDSRLYRSYLRELLEEDPEIEVVAEAGNGQDAVRLVDEVEPDLVIMDVMMPIMDGITAVKSILKRRAVPILVHTAATGEEATRTAFDALEAGALDVLPKPDPSAPQQHDLLAEDLPHKVRSLSRIRVVPKGGAVVPARPVSRPGGGPPLFVVGASTGGPQALHSVLRELPVDFRSSVVVVQHIANGFLEGLVSWISQDCEVDIRIATHGTRIEPGKVYFAPTLRHTEISGDVLTLSDGPPVNGCKPSADVLFQSVASRGRRVVGVVLTGMGQDGLEGARALRNRGSLVLVQEPRTCAVPGMPRAVIDGGQSTQVLDLQDLAREMKRLAAYR